MSILHYLLVPENIQDTPRIFTGVAEWSAVFINFFLYPRRQKGPVFAGLCVIMFLIQTGFQLLAGLSPISMWIPNMLFAVVLMYFELYVILRLPMLECGFVCIQAFLLAELSASLYRQLYVWYAQAMGESMILSAVLMIVIYALVLSVYFNIDRRNEKSEVKLAITPKDLVSAAVTGIGVFSLSNLSFIWTDTPFSATSNNMLYVRTLVDVGGVLMLMTQKDKIYETSMARENNAINQMFRRQYEQYKLSIDNSELLRKEIHDLKHYLVVLKNEPSPEKKQEFLEELEQEIAIQESFQNTGNQVLDVILTNKSLQCKKNGITLSAMVDGDVLKFMHVKDICALFGNLLDNAIEAAQMVGTVENRLITLSVKQKQNFVTVECMNFSEEALNIQDGEKLPTTTKKDKSAHGFGLKSIRQISEKYDGSMTISQNNGWVTIKVLLTNNR